MGLTAPNRFVEIIRFHIFAACSIPISSEKAFKILRSSTWSRNRQRTRAHSLSRQWSMFAMLSRSRLRWKSCDDLICTYLLCAFNGETLPEIDPTLVCANHEERAPGILCGSLRGNACGSRCREHRKPHSGATTIEQSRIPRRALSTWWRTFCRPVSTYALHATTAPPSATAFPPSPACRHA